MPEIALRRPSTVSPELGAARTALLIVLLVALLVSLSACAPSAATAAPMEVSDELHRTAVVAYHRMEIARLETGAYTTNALIDLELPRGVKWTLEAFDEADYRLRFTDDARPDVAWLVSPAGVSRAAVRGG